jgi:hypothetical protein
MAKTQSATTYFNYQLVTKHLQATFVNKTLPHMQHAPTSRPLSNFDLLLAAPLGNYEWKSWLVQVPEKLLASEHQHTERPAERKRQSLGCKGPSGRDRWRRSHVSRRAIWWIKCVRHTWVVLAWRCLPGVAGAEVSKRQALQYKRGYSARAGAREGLACIDMRLATGDWRLGRASTRAAVRASQPEGSSCIFCTT